MNEEASRGYRAIRAYIRTSTDQKYADIDSYVANELDVSEKTVRNIVNGKRPLKAGEGKSIVKTIVDNYYNNKDCDKGQLRLLFRNFLSCTEPESDSASIEKLICDITGEKYDNKKTAKLQNKKSEEEINSSLDLDEQKINRIYSNVPNSKTCTNIVRTKNLKDVVDAIDEGKVVYLAGMIGMGKKYVASSYILKCKTDGQNRYWAYIWNQKRTNEDFTFNDLIRNILATFEINTVSNISDEAKEKEAKLYLKKYKSLIVIEDFHTIPKTEQDKIFSFLLNEFDVDEISAILISNQWLDALDSEFARYAKLHEIRVKKMTVEENQRYCEIIAENKETVQKARLIYDDLFSFVYKVSGGHPFAADIVLNAMAHSLVRGVDIDQLKKKYSTFKVKTIEKDKSYGYLTELVSSIFGDMPANARRVLLALCLLETPASVKELYSITGIEGLTLNGALDDDSKLSDAIECCLKNSFIESVIRDKTVRFEIAPFLRGVVPKEIETLENTEFNSVVDTWLKYILAFAKEKMGTKFADFKKLKEMDPKDGIYPFSNVAAALNFCWERNLWSYYYDISYYARYYLYTRSISGRDKESINYKRAYVARMMNDKEKEIKALLYHTNVCCKMNEIDTVKECFDRIEQLIDENEDIRNRYEPKFVYTKALYASSKNEYEKSIKLYNEYEDMLKYRLKNIDVSEEDLRELKHDYISSLRWHSYCLYKRACDTGCDIGNAIELLDKALEIAIPLNFERAIVHATIIKVKIMLEIFKDTNSAKSEFEKLIAHMGEVDKDYFYSKDYKAINKKLYNK